MASKFSQTEVTFYDSRNCGGISVRGIELQSDEDGCIEGPPSLAREVGPHGFVRMSRDEAKKLHQERAPKQQAQQQGRR